MKDDYAAAQKMEKGSASALAERRLRQLKMRLVQRVLRRPERSASLSRCKTPSKSESLSCGRR
jgi:hypothetical protein